MFLNETQGKIWRLKITGPIFGGYVRKIKQIATLEA